MIKVNADMVHLIDSEKGETMKKSKFVAVAVLSVLAVGAGTLASCGGETEDNIINIQFVPSNDPTKLATLAKHMEPMLHEIEPNYEFKITTGTTYAATTTAMLADQVDIGFLTASGYAEVTLKNPGKVEVLMTSVRDGYKVQEDYKTEGEQRAAMNGEVAGYEYLGQQSESKVNWYSSQLVIANQYYVDANKDGKIDILDMAGLTVGRMGSTSGAGYLRPLKYLHDHGMEMVDEITDATKQIKGIDYGSAGYSAACQAMMDGDVAGFWGYTDVRYSNFYSKTDSEHYQDKKRITRSSRSPTASTTIPSPPARTSPTRRRKPSSMPSKSSSRMAARTKKAPAPITSTTSIPTPATPMLRIVISRASATSISSASTTASSSN